VLDVAGPCLWHQFRDSNRMNSRKSSRPDPRLLSLRPPRICGRILCPTDAAYSTRSAHESCLWRRTYAKTLRINEQNSRTERHKSLPEISVLAHPCLTEAHCIVTGSEEGSWQGCRQNIHFVSRFHKRRTSVSSFNSQSSSIRALLIAAAYERRLI
jgi:hypothetical protein